MAQTGWSKELVSRGSVGIWQSLLTDLNIKMKSESWPWGEEALLILSTSAVSSEKKFNTSNGKSRIWGNCLHSTFIGEGFELSVEKKKKIVEL